MFTADYRQNFRLLEKIGFESKVAKFSGQNLQLRDLLLSRDFANFYTIIKGGTGSRLRVILRSSC